jgi:lipoyl-dependent peroxiredoxin
MLEQILFTSEAHSIGGRRGDVKSDDGVIDLPMRMPIDAGYAAGSGTNPEQLFAAGFAACFESTLHFIAGQQGKKLENTRVDAHVSFGKDAAGGFGIAAELKISLPGIPAEDAHALIELGHQNCPYSKATLGNIDVKIELV